MLCRRCRRQITRDAPCCTVCGSLPNGSAPSFDLVVGDGSRIPLVGELTIGRTAANSVALADPSVSRRHARISVAADGGTATIEDVGSTYGTWVDGAKLGVARTLRDGSRIRVGDEELRVERRRSNAESARTIVVPAGASAIVRAARPDGEPEEAATTRFGVRPRLRSGYALKRLAAAEGPHRFRLKRLDSGRFVQLSDANAQLLTLLDGSRTLHDLVGEAERRFDGEGRARLVSLLSELSDGGFLAGTTNSAESDNGTEQRRSGRVREKSWRGAADAFERLYDEGGWLLFTRPALVALSSAALLGLVAFVLLVIYRYGTPFVVAKKVGLGGLVFMLGRAAVVALHETAHGLTMTSFGRRPARAGLKLVLIFPYAFVDTSDMWFEPRRRRIAVSAAGPASDFTLAGVFSLVCLAMPPGVVRQIVFQLAFAAYVGGIFNMSPLLERDGYYILVDALREPGLRLRAREYLRGRLSGRGAAQRSKALGRYAFFSLAWSVASGGFVGAMSLRNEAELARLVPRPVADLIIACLWIAVLMPALALVVPPLLDRVRRRIGAWRPTLFG